MKNNKKTNYLEKRKRRFLIFWGTFLTLGFLSSTAYVIMLFNTNRIPVNFYFLISPIKVLALFLMVTSPIYAALIYTSYKKGRVQTKKAFIIRFIFAIVFFIYSAAIFIGLR